MADRDGATMIDEAIPPRFQRPMADTTPDQRRQWQQAALDAPRRRYGLDARLLFWAEDRAYGAARSLPKFRAREISARTPYQAWEQSAYLASRASDEDALPQVASEATAEMENEQWHILVLDALIDARRIPESRFRYKLLPQLFAFGTYQLFWFTHLVKPTWSYRLNADIEDHAEHEYALLVDENPDWDRTPCPPTLPADPNNYESLADLFRQIGSDEGRHKELSEARS